MLWPSEGEIRPKSSMTFDGQFDLSIYSNYNAVYLGALIDGKLIGVNSGHKTSPIHFRSRGLYVVPEFRKQGVGSALLAATREEAKRRNCTLLWSYPKTDSFFVYEKLGFIETDRRLKPDDSNFYAFTELS